MSAAGIITQGLLVSPARIITLGLALGASSSGTTVLGSLQGSTRRRMVERVVASAPSRAARIETSTRGRNLQRTRR